jgi:hypothetical protein
MKRRQAAEEELGQPSTASTRILPAALSLSLMIHGIVRGPCVLQNSDAMCLQGTHPRAVFSFLPPSSIDRVRGIGEAIFSKVRSHLFDFYVCHALSFEQWSAQPPFDAEDPKVVVHFYVAS